MNYTNDICAAHPSC